MFIAGGVPYADGVPFLSFYPLILLSLLPALVGQLWMPPGLLLLFGFVVVSGRIGIVQGMWTVSLFPKASSGMFLSAFGCSGFLFVLVDAMKGSGVFVHASKRIARTLGFHQPILLNC